HILSILRDLTETKHTQELLKESEEKYKLLVDNAIEAIVVICESSLTFCNPEASNLTGYSIEELLAMPFSDLIYTEDRDFVSERYKQRVTGNDVESRYQFRLLKKDNSIIWVEINSTMFRWEGKPATLNFVYNINERKLAEAALQESEALYRSFINASPDDVTITDLEGRIRMISPKGVAMFGYQNKDELIGHFIFEYLIPEDHPKAQKNIELMFQGTFTGLGEYKAIHANGSILDIEANAEFILNPTGQPTGLVFIVRDITKRKLTEEAIIKLNESLKISNDIIKANLEQKNALIEELTQTKLKLEKINSEKNKFFSIIAHDLRSPFQGFLGMTKVLTQDLSSFTLAELSHIYKELDKSANNLYKLLENLLEWAEIQKESTSFTPVENSLFSAVLQCIHTIYHRAEQKRIKIINAVPETLTVYADERMLNTVIRNILSNAVKFTNTNGEIKIFAKEIGNNMIEISVADTGIGIDADNLNKIFRIDQKLRNTGTEGETGTGLGLLLCKEFVEKNGGKIWVESKIDAGSTFYFTLKKA
ncbi:MAG: PAS domain-containing sensor histidine kinase, partial [Bacteroidota bacterium]|nr:PAS domain-containing sensor histidine kinase [Bacteroidota bacterium]